MNLQCNMGEAVTGIGYQFFSATALLGTKVTTGITSPSTGIYVTSTAVCPAGAIGVRWTDVTGLIEASSAVVSRGLGTAELFETVRALITARFAASWDNRFEVVFENQPLQDSDADTFARLSIVQGTALPAAIGGRQKRVQGLLYFSIFAKEGTGTKAGTEAADLMSQIFDYAVMSEAGIVVNMRTFSLAQGISRGDYLQKNAVCNFQADSYT